MSALPAALPGGPVLIESSADPMQTLLTAAVTLRTFDHVAAACTRGPGFDPPASRVIAPWRDA